MTNCPYICYLVIFIIQYIFMLDLAFILHVHAFMLSIYIFMLSCSVHDP